MAALACQADTWLGQLTGARQTSCTGRQTGRLAGRQAQGLAGPVCSLQPVLAWKPKVAMLFCSSSFTARAMSSLAAQQGGVRQGRQESTGRQRRQGGSGGHSQQKSSSNDDGGDPALNSACTHL